MQNTFIYTPNDKATNSYLTAIFFQPLLKNGVASPLEGKIEDVRNSAIISDGICLTEELIISLKNNGNKIISFDINDNSALTHTYSNSDSVELLDLIFKISGLQKEQYDEDIHINQDLTYSKKEVRFMADHHWDIYDRMKKAGRILSLPYIPWNHFTVKAFPSWEGRNKKCIIRGGNHFLRYQLFMNLLKHDVASEQSAFFARMYYDNFCDDCKATIRNQKWISYDHYKTSTAKCNNQEIKWQGIVDVDSEFYNENHAHWNNRCMPMFYWLTEQFQKTHGPVNMNIVENALNGHHVSNFNDILGSSICNGDFKWIFSIYAPPRFWEAVQTRTINICPRFTNSQDYYPEMKEGDHYLTYDVDFSDLKEVIAGITKEQYEHIANNCATLYEEYIKGDAVHKFVVSKIKEISNEG